MDRVTLLGAIDDIPALLKRARLFVLSSQSEGISLTLLEAMASGLPVVATDVGGNSEVIEARVTGWLVPARSPSVLAEAIRVVLALPDVARAMGVAGRQRVEKCFDIRTMTARYEALYSC
jgi:glycosyltransferase involved in cell wall biosynthesis